MILLLTLNPTAGSTRQPFHAAFFGHCLKGATKVSCWLSEPSFERLVPPSWLEFGRDRKVILAVRVFTSHGFTKEQAAGMVGNLIHESDLLPTAKGDSGKSRGIAQWRGGRFRNLKEFAKRCGTSWRDYDTQLHFIVYELNGDEAQACRKLRQAKSVRAAAVAFGRHYLRPRRVESVRLENAAEVFWCM
jgi:hypothetical protein